MKISVWDTYVKRQDGLTMHFDILVPSTCLDEEKIFNYGKVYLKNKPVKSNTLTSKECVFCHMEEANTSVLTSIQNKGFYIIEMENCH